MSPILQSIANGSARGYGALLAAAGAAISFESIATVSVGSGGAADVTFSSIPGTYSHLQVRFIARAGTGSPNDSTAFLIFNSDTGSNYAQHQLYGDGSSASTSAATSQTSIFIHRIPGVSINSSTFGTVILDILDYANTNKYKTTRTLGGWDANGSGRVSFASGLWQSTSAITSLKLTAESGDFPQYSHFALYGIKGA